jgi:hypothetical protein
MGAGDWHTHTHKGASIDRKEETKRLKCLCKRKLKGGKKKRLAMSTNVHIFDSFSRAFEPLLLLLSSSSSSSWPLTCTYTASKHPFNQTTTDTFFSSLAYACKVSLPPPRASSNQRSKKIKKGSIPPTTPIDRSESSSGSGKRLDRMIESPQKVETPTARTFDVVRLAHLSDRSRHSYDDGR